MAKSPALAPLVNKLIGLNGNHSQDAPISFLFMNALLVASRPIRSVKGQTWNSTMKTMMAEDWSPV